MRHMRHGAAVRSTARMRGHWRVLVTVCVHWPQKMAEHAVRIIGLESDKSRFQSLLCISPKT